MIQFKEINGTLCIMLEKPIPLTPQAKFPCVVRLIQDDSPMGRYNHNLIDSCLEPFVCEGIKERHIQRSARAPHFALECYEIIGYPVADGSAAWAWQMAKLGIETKCHEGKIRVSKSGLIEVCYNGMAYAIPLTQSKENRQYAIDKISECSSDGWQLYEPKEEPCPTCNGTGKVEKPKQEKPRFKVGDFVQPDWDKSRTLYVDYIDKDDVCHCTKLTDIHSDDYELIHNTRLIVLSPSEVVIHIGCLSGTVRKSSTGGDYFRLFGVDGEASIDFVMLDAPTRELVKSLLKAQEENNG